MMRVPYTREQLISQIEDSLRRNHLIFCRAGVEDVLALLKQPALELPEEPTQEMLQAMYDAWMVSRSCKVQPLTEPFAIASVKAEYKALRTHLLTPKPTTKMIPVWRVEYLHKGTLCIRVFTDMDIADRSAAAKRSVGRTNVRVVKGEMEVPI